MSKINKIPSIHLLHNDERVNFAFRAMEDVKILRDGATEIPHRHEYYTILFPTKSGGNHFVDFKKYPIEKGKIFFVDPGQVHQVVPEKQTRGFVIMFTNDFMEFYNISPKFIENLSLFTDAGDNPPVEVSKILGKLKNIVNDIANTFASDEMFKQEKLGAYLRLFLIECNSVANIGLGSNNDTQKTESAKLLVRSFKALVEENFTKEHKVAFYAGSLNVTSDYINICIKTTIGNTAKEYIQNRIVVEAKRLGLHTALTTKEISYNVGFNDPAHFSKFFKNITGQSFSAFKEDVLQQFR
jgi:AraC-like DNA-binding protein